MTDNKNSNRKRAGAQDSDPGKEFLRTGSHTQDLGKLHKEYLGMEVPTGYFAASKKRILEALPSEDIAGDKIIEKSEKKDGGRIFGLKRIVFYPLAASVLLLIAIGIGIKNDPKHAGPDRDQTVIAESEGLESTDDFLIRSLLVEDAEIDRFTDDYLVEQIVVRAELSEQELENIFINSLFIEDSLVDEFLEESLLDHVVL